MRKFSKWEIAAIVLACLLSFLSILLYVYQFASNGLSNDPSYFGVFGDYIGGVLGSIVAFISVVLLYKTYTSQVESNIRQEHQQDIQQFDTTLFELLSRQRGIAKDVKNWSEIRDVIETELENFNYEPSFLKRENKLLIQKRLNDSFYDVYQANVTQLGIYFRHLQYILSFINDHSVDKAKYCTMVQAQMSDDELYVTFFFGLSIFGYKNMHPILDMYNVLAYLGATDDVMQFLEKLFYPQTKFVVPVKNAKNVVLVGGIHGVGKTTYCKILKRAFPDVDLLSASDVLKWKDPTQKEVENVADNQEKLIGNLQKIVAFEKRYILDGHFCLIESGEIKEVPLSTFERINPAFLVLVEDDVHVVADRLKKRDGKDVDLELLRRMKEKELRQATAVADSLKIHLYRVTGNVISEEVRVAMQMEI